MRCRSPDLIHNYNTIHLSMAMLAPEADTLTLFSALSGFSQLGSTSAASMSRNWPSLSWISMTASFHFFDISLKSQTIHHSSSTDSPTVVEPCRQKATEATDEGSFSLEGRKLKPCLCHIYPQSGCTESHSSCAYSRMAAVVACVDSIEVDVLVLA